MTQWPDPNKPGYPVNAEKNGWHWLSSKARGRHCRKWRANLQNWLGYDNMSVKPETCVANDWQYLGPCIPYADAFTAGSRAAREQAVAHLNGDNSDFWKAADAIQSLPLPEPAGSKHDQNVGLSGLLMSASNKPVDPRVEVVARALDYCNCPAPADRWKERIVEAEAAIFALDDYQRRKDWINRALDEYEARTK